MLRLSPLLLLLITHSYCMEMHETVERMVMVRTSGSDLQPAATGFIYKKENDGKEKVVEMGESEVMEHLSKIYEQPKAFAAPIPIAAGPFYATEDDGAKAPSNKDEKVIPVKEYHDEVDGIADEDFGNIFKNYADKYNDHNIDDYLHGLGNYDHGLYRKYGHKDHDDDGFKEYKINHHYGKGGAGDYHTEKFETYKVSGAKNRQGQDDIDIYGKHDAEQKKENQNKGEERNRFHKIYVKDSDEKGFYNDDSIKKGFGNYANRERESDDSGYEKADLHERRDDDDSTARRNEYTKESDEYKKAGNSDEEESSSEGAGQFGAKIRDFNSKSYGFAVKH